MCLKDSLYNKSEDIYEFFIKNDEQDKYLVKIREFMSKFLI